jgi:hypothetical protein
VHFDAARIEQLGRRQDVRASAIAANAERQDVLVFEEQQQIVDTTGAPVLNQRPLKS